MPQQFLNSAQVSAFRQQMGRIGVPETVRVDGGIARRYQCVQLDKSSHVAVAQAGAPIIDKQGAFAIPCAPNGEILLDCRHRVLGNRHLALLVSLSAHAQPPLTNIKIVEVDSHQLAYPDAASIQQFQKCQVAFFRRLLFNLVRDRIQHVVCRLGAHHFRQSLRRLRRSEPNGRIVRQNLFLVQKLEQRTNRGQLAANADRR